MIQLVNCDAIFYCAYERHYCIAKSNWYVTRYKRPYILETTSVQFWKFVVSSDFLCCDNVADRHFVRKSSSSTICVTILSNTAIHIFSVSLSLSVIIEANPMVGERNIKICEHEQCRIAGMCNTIECFFFVIMIYYYN